MIRRMACLVAAGLMLMPLAARAQNASKEKAGVAAAEKWLGLVDKGEYAASWKDAASSFRAQVTEQKWTKMAQSVRGPLGKLETRKLAKEAYRSSLPGAPDGQYVVLEFVTAFANKKSAVETVATVLDKDGKWRVVGYFIR